MVRRGGWAGGVSSAPEPGNRPGAGGCALGTSGASALCSSYPEAFSRRSPCFQDAASASPEVEPWAWKVQAPDGFGRTRHGERRRNLTASRLHVGRHASREILLSWGGKRMARAGRATIIMIIVVFQTLAILVPPQEKRISLLARPPTCGRRAVGFLLRSPCLVRPIPSGASTFKAQGAAAGLAEAAS